MARKIFISVLGTGYYGLCKYQKNDFTSSETRFIQTATLSYIGAKEWNKNDIVYILLTSSARKMNWEEHENGVRHNNITDKDEEYHGLHTEIDMLSFPCRTEDLSIPNGKDEKEMWDIFEILYEVIEENDELYIDLTHSFRYIPMLVIVFSNYVKFLKHAKVVYMSYGNYEARDKETNVAPIVDLLPLSALQDWTAAADQYLSSGNISKLNKLYLPLLQSKLRDSLGKDENAKKMKGFIVHFCDLINDRLTCQGKKIIESKGLSQVVNDFGQLQNVPIPEPFKPILQEIQTSLKDFDVNTNIVNGLKAAQWSFENGSFQQCVTLLQETIICYVCSSEDISWSDKDIRDTVNSSFAISCQDIPEKNWKLIGNGEEEKNVNKSLIHKLLLNKQLNLLKDDYAFLSEIRNQYNHAGMLDIVKFDSKAMIENIDKLTKKIISKVTKATMLINLSNHPSALWPSEQLEAANSIYHDIVDIVFPSISPEIDEIGINHLVDNYIQIINGITEGRNYEVHVMGEMTFTLLIVKRLQEKGITCIASTTERKVTEMADGKRITQFNFVRFRKYSE